ncbi:MAG: hypothetical protein JWN04_4227 [Myxococcaceae bacterium]|nr:hypothetical protein [Myxococcaceae bacterium]
MKRNVSNGERWSRAMASAAMLLGSVLAPVSLLTRVAVFGTMGLYLLFTALSGTCFGYRLMGRSSCPADTRG